MASFKIEISSTKVFILTKTKKSIIFLYFLSLTKFYKKIFKQNVIRVTHI